MKQSIQERMERQIALATKFNTIFDIVVTASEVSLEATSTNPSENRYDVANEYLNTQIVCNDNDWNTVVVYIIDPARQGESANVGTLTINGNGEIDETLHNIPRAIRRIVNDYIDDIYEAIEEWIDGESEPDGGDE